MDNKAKRSSDFLKLWQTVRSPRARPAGLKSHRSLSFVSFIRCTEILSSQAFVGLCCNCLHSEINNPARLPFFHFLRTILLAMTTLLYHVVIAAEGLIHI